MWQYRVVKLMRGMSGEYFDFPTAATFRTARVARRYARAFAAEQGASRVSGARIDVRKHGGRGCDRTVATYYSDDYMPDRQRVVLPDGTRTLHWRLTGETP